MKGWPALLGLVTLAALLGVFEVGRQAWIARKIAYLDGFDAAFNKCFGVEPASEVSQKRIYVVGDSIAEEWPLRNLDRAYEPVRCGMPGETTAQLERRFDRFDFLHPDDVVVLVSGTYDAIGASFSPPDRLPDLAQGAAARLRRLAQAARDHGGRVIVITILPPFSPEWLRLPFWRESIRDFTEKANAALRAQDWGQGVELLDIARVLGGDDRHTPDIWGRNGIKLNQRGYEAISAEINRWLAQSKAPGAANGAAPGTANGAAP